MYALHCDECDEGVEGEHREALGASLRGLLGVMPWLDLRTSRDTACHYRPSYGRSGVDIKVAHTCLEVSGVHLGAGATGRAQACTDERQLISHASRPCRRWALQPCTWNHISDGTAQSGSVGKMALGYCACWTRQPTTAVSSPGRR